MSISNSEAKSRAIWFAGLGAACLAASLTMYKCVALSPIAYNHYLAATLDKRDHLMAADKAENELLIFGSSAVAFSVSAESISNVLDTPVFNLGVQAFMGLDPLRLYAPHLDATRNSLVIVVDHGLIGAEAGLTPSKCDLVFLQKSLSALWNAPKCLSHVIWRQYQEIRHYVFAYQQHSVYQRKNFNAYGDMTGHLRLPLKGSKSEAEPLKLSPAKVDYFIRNVSQLAKGFDVIIAPPPVSVSFCTRNGEELTALVAKLHTALSTVKTTAPELICLADELEFDSILHYGVEGRDQYSEYIAALVTRQNDGK